MSPVRRSPIVGDRIRFEPRTGHGFEQVTEHDVPAGSEGVVRRIDDTLYGSWYSAKLDSRPGLVVFDQDDIVLA